MISPLVIALGIVVAIGLSMFCLWFVDSNVEISNSLLGLDDDF